MKYYPDELKASVIARMLHPNNANIPELSKETGIPKDTLYMWRLKARGHRFNPTSQQHAVKGLNSEDKFNIVVETASMNQEELSAYCRSKGLRSLSRKLSHFHSPKYVHYYYGPQ